MTRIPTKQVKWKVTVFCFRSSNELNFEMNWKALEIPSTSHGVWASNRVADLEVLLALKVSVDGHRGANCCGSCCRWNCSDIVGNVDKTWRISEFYLGWEKNIHPKKFDGVGKKYTPQKIRQWFKFTWKWQFLEGRRFRLWKLAFSASYLNFFQEYDERRAWITRDWYDGASSLGDTSNFPRDLACSFRWWTVCWKRSNGCFQRNPPKIERHFKICLVFVFRCLRCLEPTQAARGNAQWSLSAVSTPGNRWEIQGVSCWVLGDRRISEPSTVPPSSKDQNELF